jgi:hypothetical protein
MAVVSLWTRKPVEKLTLGDFRAFPVWKYADDEEGIEGRDETWVRPVDTTVVPKLSYTHVAADFTAACGKEFAGFVTVNTLNGPPAVRQGVILHKREQLFISNPEAFRFDESRKHLLGKLGLNEQEVFPLSFRLRVAVAGREKYSGGELP